MNSRWWPPMRIVTAPAMDPARRADLLAFIDSSFSAAILPVDCQMKIIPPAEPRPFRARTALGAGVSPLPPPRLRIVHEAGAAGAWWCAPEASP